MTIQKKNTKNIEDKSHYKIRNSYRNNRKGIVDVQFNWIFVLIAGFIIFLFIISIVFTQKRHSDAQSGITSINQITTLLKGKQQTSNVYSEITIPSTDITFRCDANEDASGGYFTFKIANAARTQLPTEIIFAPQEINTNKIMIWSQAFTVGFPINVFTYITTADSIIMIYNSSGTSDSSRYAKELFTDLDEVSNITHKYSSTGNEYLGFNRRKIVCFNNDCPTPANKYDYVNIDVASNAGLFDYGNVTFHKEGNLINTDVTLPYITKAGLYGAIFSDTSSYYSCQMYRAMNQFEVKRTLMESRMTIIQDKLDYWNYYECRRIVNITLDFNIIPMQNPALNWDNVTFMDAMAKKLDSRNNDLGYSSCPKLY